MEAPHSVDRIADAPSRPDLKPRIACLEIIIRNPKKSRFIGSRYEIYNTTETAYKPYPKP